MWQILAKQISSEWIFYTQIIWPFFCFQDISKLTPLSPEVISRQATINIGTIGHVAHGKSTVVKAISGVHTVRFKNELERNITIKLGKHSPFLLRSIIKMPSFKIQSYWFGHVANPKLDSTQYKTENQFYEWKKKHDWEWLFECWICTSKVVVCEWCRCQWLIENKQRIFRYTKICTEYEQLDNYYCHTHFITSKWYFPIHKWCFVV